MSLSDLYNTLLSPRKSVTRQRAVSSVASSTLSMFGVGFLMSGEDFQLEARIDNTDTVHKIGLNELINRMGGNTIQKLDILNESDVTRLRLISRRLTQVLTKDSSVKMLSFENSSYDDDLVGILAVVIPQYESLNSLRVDGKYGNSGAKVICDAASQLPSLSKIGLAGPFSDEGLNAVISLIEKKPLVEVGVRKAEITMKETYQRFCSALKYNTSLEFLEFPELADGVQENIVDCFSVNTTLTTVFNSNNESLKWWVQLNQICKEMNIPKIIRDQVPKDLKTKKDIQACLTKLVKQNSKGGALENLQKADDQYRELCNKIALLEAQLGKFKATHKKVMAKYLLGKALELVDHTQLSEARCVLEIALGLNKEEEEKKEESEEVLKEEDLQEYITRIGDELMGQIEDQLEYSEDQRQEHLEVKISAMENEMAYAEQQAVKAKSEEEVRMIREQMEVMGKEMSHLKNQVQTYEGRHKALQEQEVQLEKRRQQLQEQTRQFEEMILHISTVAPDTSPLRTQVVAIAEGDKGVEAAHRRYASMQKAAQDAQQKVKEEERRQRSRVELLQKQMELYHQKGMSPIQRSYRNFLKDVKRLLIVRSHIERTPHPFKCFISYAWETDPNANKELQDRLQRLKDDLEVAGIEVMLDLRDMKGDMKKFMKQGVGRAHKVLLVCTPRLKERAADPTPNNLQLELKEALKKEKSTPGFILPVVMSGNFGDSMPPQVSHLLSINITPKVDYYTAIGSLAPMGLIPMALGLERNKDFKKTHDRFFDDIKEFAAHHAAVQAVDKETV